MRSQKLPPALCFLVALLLSCGFPIHAAKDSKPKVEASKKVANIPSYFYQNTTISENAVIKSTPKASLIVDTQSMQTISPNTVNNSNDNLSNVQPIVKNMDYASAVTTPASFNKGMFYGFTIMVVLLNLICFLFFEEKIFLLFSIALIAITVTFLQSDSLLSLIGIGEITNFEALQSTFLLLATVLASVFASHYLTLKEFYPKLKWFTSGLLLLASMMVFSGWISETQLFTGLANTILISVTAIYFAAAVMLFSKKNYAKFYVIAFAIPVLFALDFFVLKKLGIQFLGTQSFHLKVAMLAEMLIVTYAIMYRMRAIKEEHQLRQTEMRIFLKRQEVINRSSTEKLMQDIYLENLIMQYDLDGLEIKLLQYISEGKDNTKIARKLKTTEVDIELLTKGLYNKLEVGVQIKEDIRMVETQPDYIYN